MKKAIYKFAVAAFAVASLNACSLDEYNPSGKTGEDVLTTFEGLKGLQAYCYQPLYGQLFSAYDFLSVAEGGTDCWLTPAKSTDYAKQVIYYDELATGTNATNKLWGQAYSQIGNCNAVVNRAAEVTDGSASEINTLVAEARCLRAYYYSILVTFYGNVTLTLEESTQDPVTSPVRSTIPELYAQIVEDLKFAANNLGVTPYEGNRSRVTKKTALGLLARVYAQGAGEYPELNLQDNGKSYWQCAKETAEDLINKATSYGARLYEDIEDMWAQGNNQSNEEALFIAAGPNVLNANTYNLSNYSNLHTYIWPQPSSLSAIFPCNNARTFQYGRVNNNTLAPSKYLLDCFDAENDRRWEVTFTTAFGQMSAMQDGGDYLVAANSKNYSEHFNQKGASYVEITQAICDQYGINPSFIGQKIYPYMDLKGYWTEQWLTQISSAKIWPKGDHSGNVEVLQETKNPLVVPYPLDADDDRFNIYLSKEPLSDTEKAERIYYCINIDDLFQSRGNGYEYRTTEIKVSGDNNIYPALNKYTWLFDGSRTSNLQRFAGDIFIMRMAEVYLIAAEANVALGDGDTAARYINALRKRAARSTAPTSFYSLTSVDMDDVFDEQARELCGEFQRWAMMKRHKDSFVSRLEKGNPRAAEIFDPSKHYLRPISYNFLSQIDNPDEYGTNGY